MYIKSNIFTKNSNLTYLLAMNQNQTALQLNEVKCYTYDEFVSEKQRSLYESKTRIKPTRSVNEQDKKQDLANAILSKKSTDKVGDAVTAFPYLVQQMCEKVYGPNSIDMNSTKLGKERFEENVIVFNNKSAIRFYTGHQLQSAYMNELKLLSVSELLSKAVVTVSNDDYRGIETVFGQLFSSKVLNKNGINVNTIKTGKQADIDKQIAEGVQNIKKVQELAALVTESINIISRVLNEETSFLSKKPDETIGDLATSKAKDLLGDFIQILNKVYKGEPIDSSKSDVDKGTITDNEIRFKNGLELTFTAPSKTPAELGNFISGLKMSQFLTQCPFTIKDTKTGNMKVGFIGQLFAPKVIDPSGPKMENIDSRDSTIAANHAKLGIAKLKEVGGFDNLIGEASK